jgi:cytochrome c-type biogenesis protein CcmH
MKAGRTEEEIVAFLTARYGDFVLYEPPVRPTTYLLWFGPFVLLIGGLFLLYRYVKKRRDLIPNAPLSPQERARAEHLLKTNPEKEIA